MVFTEEVFLYYFLPLALLGYFLIPIRSNSTKGSPFLWRNAWLTLSGYAFYAWFEPWFVLPMIWTNVFDYFVGGLLGKDGLKQRTRNLLLLLSICMNLGLLGVFKYAVFFQVNWNALLHALGHPGFEILRIAFPIGISFYTFHSMSYIIDIWRGERPVRSFPDFSCFVTLFPQLVAGPILRYHLLAPQLHTRTHRLDKFAQGIQLFMVGFAMKILLANPVGKIADDVFAMSSPTPSVAWWGALAFMLQIYFDFNGYSIMAYGLGRMFGFELIRNFDAPYRSESITEFWRRWHISLSSWLREYLYYPLGGNRKGKARTYINLALVMLLGGFWHGAQWQFIIWGGIHGSWLAFERWLGKDSLYHNLPRILRIAITMVIVLIAWVFFRAENVSHAFHYLACMFGLSAPIARTLLLTPSVFPHLGVLLMALCMILVLQPFQAYEWAVHLTWPRLAISSTLFFVAVVTMYTQSFNPFLYFQF